MYGTWPQSTSTRSAPAVVEVRENNSENGRNGPKIAYVNERCSMRAALIAMLSRLMIMLETILRRPAGYMHRNTLKPSCIETRTRPLLTFRAADRVVNPSP
jgi:hypothetical protein